METVKRNSPPDGDYCGYPIHRMVDDPGQKTPPMKLLGPRMVFFLLMLVTTPGHSQEVDNPVTSRLKSWGNRVGPYPFASTINPAGKEKVRAEIQKEVPGLIIVARDSILEGKLSYAPGYITLLKLQLRMGARPQVDSKALNAAAAYLYDQGKNGSCVMLELAIESVQFWKADLGIDIQKTIRLAG